MRGSCWRPSRSQAELLPQLNQTMSLLVQLGLATTTADEGPDTAASAAAGADAGAWAIPDAWLFNDKPQPCFQRPGFE